jgi:hypothetical protein
MMRPDPDQFATPPARKSRWHPVEILLIALLAIGEGAALAGAIWAALT